MSPLDYLAVGHVARDITPTGVVTGGTVAYAGATARMLGCRTAILTSCAPDFEPDLGSSGVLVHCLPASETTTFENIYRGASRTQFLHGRAARLGAAQVPAGWRTASIVHLAPIAGEVDPALVTYFPNSLLGLTPQGWLRRWSEDGRVYAAGWHEARQTLPLAAAVVLSEQDLADRQWLKQFRKWARLLVVTQGASGCTVYMADEVRHVAAPPADEQDPTGAGDIFAAAFFVRLLQTKGNPWEAARFANELAARSVSQRGLPAKVRLMQRQKEA